MAGGKGNHFEKPEYYLNKSVIASLEYSAVKIRGREFLEKYTYNAMLFLHMSRGDAHGYKDEV